MIGYNHEQEMQALKEIVRMENYACRAINTNRIITLDGTKYFTISDKLLSCGIELDQLIIADDNRWNVYQEKRSLIKQAKLRLFKSCVPDDFLIIELEI